MSVKVVFAAAVLTLFASQAYAEGEGNGEPFPFQAGPQVSVGRPFVADTGSAAYPTSTGSTAQPSSMARLAPSIGSEPLVQTTDSLPRGFGSGTVANAQAQSINRHFARRSVPLRPLDSGAVAFRG